MSKYIPHITAALAFGWFYIQPGVLNLIQALAHQYPHATVFTILALIIGAYHAPSPSAQI